MARVLIIEDYLSIQTVYKNVLEKGGHTVTTADTGKAALTIVRKKKFDIILLDILLPAMDGVSFLRAFDCKAHPDPRVVVTTNMDDPDLRRQAMELGATGYIIKADLTPDQLLATVKQASPA